MLLREQSQEEIGISMDILDVVIVYLLLYFITLTYCIYTAGYEDKDEFHIINKRRGCRLTG